MHAQKLRSRGIANSVTFTHIFLFYTLANKSGYNMPATSDLSSRRYVWASRLFCLLHQAILALCNALGHLLLANRGVNTADGPDKHKHGERAKSNGDRLPVSSSPRVIIGNNQIPISEIIDQVESSQGQSRTAHGIHKCLVKASGIINDRHCGFEVDICRAFWQDDAKVHTPVRDALDSTGPFEERHLEHIRVALGQLAQIVRQICVPPHTETVFPVAENRVTRLQLEQVFLLARTEARGRDIANIVGEVGVHCTRGKGQVQALECESRWVHV